MPAVRTCSVAVIALVATVFADTGGIGDSSFDATAGSLDGMFDFRRSDPSRLILKADGAVASGRR